MNIYDKSLAGSYGTNNDLSAVYNKSDAAEHTPRHTLTFTQGQTIKGEVASVNGNEVTIRLSNQTLINARLDGNAVLMPGQNAVFEITSADSTLIALKLMTPESSDSGSVSIIINKALEEAGLINNKKNADIVMALLNNRLPINKSSIQKLIQQTAIYKNVSPDTLAIMDKHNILVNDVTSSQFEAFRINEGTLTNELADFTDSVISVLSQDDAPPAAVKAILTFLSSDDYNSADITKNVLHSDIPDENSVHETLHNIDRIINSPSDKIYSSDTQNIHSKASIANAAKSETIFSFSEFTQKALSDVVNSTSRFVNPENSEVLNNNIFTAADGSYYIPSAQNAAELPLLLRSPDYKDFFKEVLLNHFTLSVGELKKPGALKGFYNRLTEEIELLDEEIKKETSNEKNPPEHFKAFLEKSNELKDNLDFMKSLNNIFTYIQLPMRLNNKTAHADLYVYKRNKKAALSSESVTALIHLNMEYLGYLDIHIKLTGKNLNIGFFAADSLAAPIIASNMNLLEQSLENKGFELNASVNTLDKKPDPVKDHLLMNEGEELIKRFSFDKRA